MQSTQIQDTQTQNHCHKRHWGQQRMLLRNHLQQLLRLRPHRPMQQLPVRLQQPM